MDLAHAGEWHEIGLLVAPPRQPVGPRLPAAYIDEVVARVDGGALAVAYRDPRDRFGADD